MLEVDEALSCVRQTCAALDVVEVDALQAPGSVLAADVTSDIDSPPYDKAMMDGYAVRAEDVRTVPVELEILEEVTAGNLPTREVVSGFATRIMTGAPMPDGADAVVMVERTKLAADDESSRVVILESLSAGQNVMRRATSLAAGQVVLKAPRRLRAMDLGLLSEVGKTHVPVHRQPSIAILSTGDELVPAAETPRPGQIRNSNGPMLLAQSAAAGGLPTALGIARDNKQQLAQLVEQGLTHDVFVLSGGVSAGVLDLVPGVLAAAGVEQVFHKVNLKPGKPLWFGQTNRCKVFGLPGNPVSSLVCFELFVRPALRWLAGESDGELPRRKARLTAPHQQRGDRPTFFPASLEETAEGAKVTPVAWLGSGDQRSLSEANCLCHFPAGDRSYAEGDEVVVRPLP